MKQRQLEILFKHVENLFRRNKLGKISKSEDILLRYYVRKIIALNTTKDDIKLTQELLAEMLVSEK